VLGGKISVFAQADAVLTGTDADGWASNDDLIIGLVFTPLLRIVVRVMLGDNTPQV